jgi:thymidylate synthase (FAD)
MSTRYVDFANEDRVGDHILFVAPPHKNIEETVSIRDGGNVLDVSFSDMCCMIEAFYKALRENGWTPEEARQILPIGLATEIVVTANFREWRHILELRCGRAAHWEIRSVMCKLLDQLKQVIPGIFFDFEKGEECKNGFPTYILNSHYEDSQQS